MKRYLH
ncbi:hypothetical protein CP061683_0869A, partial [Chlamydia psittaci 06-1683]